MFSTHAVRTRLRGAGTAVWTGILISMLATTPMFAQSASLAPAANANATDTTDNSPMTAPRNLVANTNSTTDRGASSVSLLAEANLPAAPAPVAAAGPAADPLGQEAVKNLTSNNNQHKVKRPGQLAAGILGAGLMGIGAYIYAGGIGGNAKGRGIVGSIFFAPGAVAAGFGFTLAFKPKN